MEKPLGGVRGVGGREGLEGGKVSSSDVYGSGGRWRRWISEEVKASEV